MPDGIDHVVVDVVSDSLGEMRRPVGHALTRKRSGILDAEKRRHRGRDGNESFHLLLPSLNNYIVYRLDFGRAPCIRLYSKKKLRVVSRLTFVNVRCR